ncbi:MAG: transglycosylase SLT domain-containing protein [bacterium]
MIQSRWLLLSVWCLSLLPFNSKFENRHVFKWDAALKRSVDSVYGGRDKVFYRLAQVYSESGFNPLATSDYGGWKKAGLDTVAGIKQGKGAAGVTQFIWSTATMYGAKGVDPAEAFSKVERPVLYNPFWGIRAMSRYMLFIEQYLIATKNPKVRHRMMFDEKLCELVATAGYNTGPARLKNRLEKHGANWEVLKLTILSEPRDYAEKIVRIADQMRKEERWAKLKSGR